MSNYQAFAVAFLATSFIGFLLAIRIVINEIIDSCVIKGDGKWVVSVARIFVIVWILMAFSIIR